MRKQKVLEQIQDNKWDGYLQAIKDGVDMDIVDIDGSTPLHHAAWYEMFGFLETDILKIVLSNTKNVNAQNKMGNTALHLVIQEGGLSCKENIEMLIQAGADLTITNKDGHHVFILTLFRCDQRDILKLIFEKMDNPYLNPSKVFLYLIKCETKFPDTLETKFNFLMKCGFKPSKLCLRQNDYFGCDLFFKKMVNDGIKLEQLLVLCSVYEKRIGKLSPLRKLPRELLRVLSLFI